VNASARPLVVLIVDDDLVDVLLIREVLKLAGHPGAIHVSADEAIDFLRRAGKYAGAPRPDLVLLDPNRPGRDGPQVLAEIASDPHLAGIPVVVFTASQDPDDVLTSYSLHANAHVTKPVELKDFRAAVIAIVGFFATVAVLPAPADPLTAGFAGYWERRVRAVVGDQSMAGGHA
jgi:CheY-like chemotaxis protein